MLLDGKNAVIYGAGGSIGSAAASAFAREGARVYLAGRTPESLDRTASQIRSAGGAAETAQVDALDERAVDEHAESVAAEAGSLDISVNLISHGDVQGKPLAEMSTDDFERPVRTAVRTVFLTAGCRWRSARWSPCAAVWPASSGHTASAWSRYRRAGYPRPSPWTSTGAS